MTTYKIYTITNILNDRTYVGLTRKTPKERLRDLITWASPFSDDYWKLGKDKIESIKCRDGEEDI